MSRVENFCEINKRAYLFIRHLRVEAKVLRRPRDDEDNGEKWFQEPPSDNSGG